MNKWIEGGLAIAGIINIAVIGTPVGVNDREVLIVSNAGSKARLQSGEIVRVVDPGHPWGRCDNPQTQADIDYCKAKGTGVVFTVRTVDFITEAEANSINAFTLRAKLNDAKNPTSFVTLP